jgi:hypothetical protein
MLIGLVSYNDKNKKPAKLELDRLSREEGIRTPDAVSRIHTFQACSFNHSDTSLYEYFCFPSTVKFYSSFYTTYQLCRAANLAAFCLATEYFLCIGCGNVSYFLHAYPFYFGQFG